MATWGIMGGSFDPIHSGHVFMAQAVMRHVRPDGILFIPTGDPPHKSRLAPSADRLAMVGAAIACDPAFRASDIEVARDETTYTIDTLRQLREDNPGDSYVYIVGADTLLVIETWRTFELVPPMLRGIACVPRPEVDMNLVRAKADELREKYGLQIWLIDEMAPDISSTEVRLLVERGRQIDHLVPGAVAEYIKKHKLYRDPMLDKLRKSLNRDRYNHTLGVEKAALELAQKNGVDPGKARIAALLHDCAKCMSEHDMLQLLKRHDMVPRHKADRTKTLMHAAAGMVLAKEEYGVTDEEILGAIRWHTTGHAGMTKLEKLIYLADVIEQGRRPFPSLAAIRKATEEGLDQGMKLAAECTLSFLDQRGVLPDPNTIELLKEYQQTTGKEI